MVGVDDGPAEKVGKGVSVGSWEVGEDAGVVAGDVARGEASTGNGVNDGAAKGELKRGDSGTVAVGGGVSVVPASTTWGVGVSDGVGVGIGAKVSVGEVVTSSGVS
jgi:hypothetical protein